VLERKKDRSWDLGRSKTRDRGKREGKGERIERWIKGRI
jgi:hypothetical protein